MIDLALVGVGMGAPSHLTGEAIAALRAAEAILIPRKGADKADLAEARRAICDRFLGPSAPVVEFDLPVRATGGDYLTGVRDWHDAVAQAWAAALRHALPDGGRVALMIWGDPGLYDSSLRIAGRLGALGAPARVTVIPGVTSLQLLTAAFAIPLNPLGGPVLITTGRRLREGGWPACADAVAVMLDGGCAFETVPPDGVEIFWGAYVGMPEQMLRAGPLSEAGPAILAARAEARARHGWIMDIYLLRRVRSAEDGA